ncbi:Glutathione S-transferase [Cinnamomum micranthum f. kanehirae]|uniref:Glutathione S-transferase n=1 Tax=Cinnamomum micranthum f. kanehirae TaxID=337451 RepID=A0A3S3NJR6_9MAGN|nr:Glutathione S-transferase [Cinnamomum micranthum f. kanehirae]
MSVVSFSPKFQHLLLLPNKPRKSKPNCCHVSPRMSSQPPPTPDLLSTVTNLLWGKSLPPQLLISTVRSTWNATWHLMMSQLAPSDPSGSYSRPVSSFRANSPSRQNPKNLHLYVALACPWAHRTLIVRSLKGLDEAVPVSVAGPGIDGSWEFREAGGSGLGPSADRANGCRTLKEVYRLRRGGYDGRSTVPMLWDVDKKDVFCNESYDIIEFFNSGLNGEMAGDSTMDLSPPALKGEIEYWNGIIYPNVNNGVYRCGFAQSQQAYDKAVNDLFNTLDMLDAHLSSSRYLCGDVLTLADVCLFTTMIRFDLAYNVLFKCTKKKLQEYPHLHAYTREIYQIPKVAVTCNFEAIMDGYYRILFPLNPGGIRPAMPCGCEHEFLCKPHNRESISLSNKHAEVLQP